MDSLLSKLEQAGAVIDQQGVVERFADAEHEAQCAVSGSAVALLNGLAAVQVSGADARGFLAGQLSSDIATLDSRHIQLSSWCSAQGRVLSAAWVLPRSAEQWLLIVPRDLADQMTKRLKMFVLRAKVTVELADDLVVLGVAGNTPDIIPQPADVLDLLTTDGLSVARIPGVDRRYLCIADLAQGEDLWTLLTTVLNPIGATLTDIYRRC
jgi:folate-binding Fe-S cluster repair protein YgfZ